MLTFFRHPKVHLKLRFFRRVYRQRFCLARCSGSIAFSYPFKLWKSTLVCSFFISLSVSSMAFMMSSFLPCFSLCLIWKEFVPSLCSIKYLSSSGIFSNIASKFALRSFSWDQTVRTYLDILEDQSQNFLLKCLQSDFLPSLPQLPFFLSWGCNGISAFSLCFSFFFCTLRFPAHI